MSTRTLDRGGRVGSAPGELHADVLVEDGREAPDARYAETDGDRAIAHASRRIMSDVTPAALKETALLVQEGTTSSKAFIRSRDQGFSHGAARVRCEVAE
ncbi:MULTISPECIES: hypothetical protein [unclassified Streptomyces]|uniref:hypothetical protein n=1 Tax=unclassified Streptomyces TaxID=2593676 RepID=UPI0036F75A39